MPNERAGAVAGSRSSNARLLAVGVAVLVIGVILVLVIIRNADDPAATSAPAGTPTDPADAAEPTEEETLSPEQLSSARLQLPLDVPEGTEAVAVRASFMRSVAAVPTPGDLVNLYRLAAPVPEDADAQDTEDPPTGETATAPDPGEDAEQVLTEVEVLGVTGPLPSTNDGTVTLVVAVPTDDVATVMPVANTASAWFTLLPTTEDAATGAAATDGATEEES